MTEYQRTQNGIGEVFQWVDAEVFMVWDMYHQEPDRLSGGRGVFATEREALDYVKGMIGWELRLVILKLPAIRGYRVSDNG